LVRRLPAACVLVGEGAERFGPEIRQAVGEGVRVAPSAASAVAVGRLGVARLARGERVLPAAAVPHYLRRAEAEVVRTGERFEAPPKPR